MQSIVRPSPDICFDKGCVYKLMMFQRELWVLQFLDMFG